MEGENNTNQNNGATSETVQSTPVQSVPMSTAQKNTLMGVLAYLGVLVIIPYLVAKHEPFVLYHIKQGLVLVVIELGVLVIGMTVWGLGMLLGLINLATIVLSIIGIINVVQGKEKELPFVGQFSKHFTI